MKTLIKEHTRPADGGGIRYLLFEENAIRISIASIPR